MGRGSCQGDLPKAANGDMGRGYPLGKVHVGAADGNEEDDGVLRGTVARAPEKDAAERATTKQELEVS